MCFCCVYVCLYVYAYLYITRIPTDTDGIYTHGKNKQKKSGALVCDRSETENQHISAARTRTHATATTTRVRSSIIGAKFLHHPHQAAASLWIGCDGCTRGPEAAPVSELRSTQTPTQRQVRAQTQTHTHTLLMHTTIHVNTCKRTHTCACTYNHRVSRECVSTAYLTNHVPMTLTHVHTYNKPPQTRLYRKHTHIRTYTHTHAHH